MKRFYSAREKQSLLHDLGSLRSAISDRRYVQGTSPVLRIGAERESFLIDRSGRPALVAPALIARLGKTWCKPEFPKFAVEISTDAIAWGSEALYQLGIQLAERTNTLRESARAINASLLDIGLLPSFLESQLLLGEEVCSPHARYRNLLKYLGERNGAYKLSLTGFATGQQIDFNVFASPVPGGITGSFQPNVQFGPDILGHAANLTVATAWIWPILGSTSPLAFGQECAWDSRIPVWQSGMDPEKILSPFGPGHYYRSRGAESVIEWAESLIEGEVILNFEESEFEVANHRYPYISLATGTKWTQTGRLRMGLDPSGSLNLYFEQRLLDTGLTIADDIANMALYLGLIVELSDCESAAMLVNYADAENAFFQAANFGNCNVKWRGSKVDGRQIILDKLIPLAYDGLRKLAVSKQHAAQLLSTIERRLRFSQTGADFLLGAHRRYRVRQSDEEAAFRVCREIAEFQRQQSWSGYDAPGIADFLPEV